jgi:hypothetical protein
VEVIKMNGKRVIIFLLSLALLAAFAVSTARAQLIENDKLLKVVKIDTDKSRIEICSTSDKPDRTTGYVFVEGKTICHKDGKDFDWKKLEKGWVIRVRGGVRFDMNVNAKEIWVVKLN